MENIFAKRRARLLAMKAMRENYVPGEKLVTCPHCGGESQRKDVAAALSVCPLCGYHFPMGPITGSAACWTPAPSGSCTKS